ncbi:hypothetical protein KSS87_017320 [Heliosperma pusillum]|nr:hypothetical protein KSS87_017320 [Heliosperma pusillum]
MRFHLRWVSHSSSHLPSFTLTLKMIKTILLAVFIPTIAGLIWETINRFWLKPKKIEKLLRQQGLNGNSYKLFVGDVMEIYKESTTAFQQPISFSTDHLPRITGFFYKSIQKHGKNCFAWIGPIPWLIIAESEKIKEVLTRHEDFQKPNHPFTQLLMVGIVGVEGEKWAKHRKIITPAFHKDKLKHMFAAVYESCSMMVTSWEDLISKEKTTELDVWPFIESLTGDVISRTAFGSSSKESRKIIHLLEEQCHLSVYDPQPSNYIPGWRYLPTKNNRRVKEICRQIEELLTKMIQSRKHEMEIEGISKNDLLGILLESNKREIEAHDNQKGKGLTTHEVVQECKIFYLAGSETTSALLVWTLISLCIHQTWQDRARDEVLRVIGKDGKLTLEKLSQLKIVNMILCEVLRFYSPIFMLIRKVHKDVQLGELLVPANTELLLPLCIAHQDCDAWGEDAKEFNPTRFEEGISKATEGQAVYFPFSIGPRICIGQNFALMEAKVTLTLILQRFSLQISPTDKERVKRRQLYCTYCDTRGHAITICYQKLQRFPNWWGDRPRTLAGYRRARAACGHGFGPGGHGFGSRSGSTASSGTVSSGTAPTSSPRHSSCPH